MTSTSIPTQKKKKEIFEGRGLKNRIFVQIQTYPSCLIELLKIRIQEWTEDKSPFTVRHFPVYELVISPMHSGDK